MDVPINEFNFDRDLSPHFKESWCKRLNPYLLPNYKAQPPLRGTPEDDINLNIQFTPNELAIIDAANKFGPKIQLNCVGYMANKRQWRMCGLAVIDVAQHLKKCWQGGYTVVSTLSSVILSFCKPEALEINMLFFSHSTGRKSFHWLYQGT